MVQTKTNISEFEIQKFRNFGIWKRIFIKKNLNGTTLSPLPRSRCEHPTPHRGEKCQIIRQNKMIVVNDPLSLATDGDFVILCFSLLLPFYKNPLLDLGKILSSGSDNILNLN